MRHQLGLQRRPVRLHPPQHGAGRGCQGRHSNIAAGNITANYDGYEKHATTIGDNVRTGSDTTIVAPVTIGDGAFTAAGSVITRDVPPGALGVSRGKQENIDGYAERRAARRLKEQSEEDAHQPPQVG